MYSTVVQIEQTILSSRLASSKIERTASTV